MPVCRSHCKEITPVMTRRGSNLGPRRLPTFLYIGSSYVSGASFVGIRWYYAPKPQVSSPLWSKDCGRMPCLSMFYRFCGSKIDQVRGLPRTSIVVVCWDLQPLPPVAWQKCGVDSSNFHKTPRLPWGNAANSTRRLSRQGTALTLRSFFFCSRRISTSVMA